MKESKPNPDLDIDDIEDDIELAVQMRREEEKSKSGLDSHDPDPAEEEEENWYAQLFDFFVLVTILSIVFLAVFSLLPPEITEGLGGLSLVVGYVGTFALFVTVIWGGIKLLRRIFG